MFSDGPVPLSGEADQSLNDPDHLRVQIHDCIVVRNTAPQWRKNSTIVAFDTIAAVTDSGFFIRRSPKPAVRSVHQRAGRQEDRFPGENRKLLSADQGCQTVDGGDAGADIVTRIFTGDRI